MQPSRLQRHVDNVNEDGQRELGLKRAPNQKERSDILHIFKPSSCMEAKVQLCGQK
jgi:hypothetical protein